MSTEQIIQKAIAASTEEQVLEVFTLANARILNDYKKDMAYYTPFIKALGEKPEYKGKNKFELLEILRNKTFINA